MNAIERLKLLRGQYTVMMWVAGVFTILMAILFLTAYVKLIIGLIWGFN